MLQNATVGWTRQADRSLVFDGGIATVRPAPNGGKGVLVTAYGVEVGVLDLDESGAQAMLERLVLASRGVGSWRDGWRTGMVEGAAWVRGRALDEGMLEVADLTLDELERRFGPT